MTDALEIIRTFGFPAGIAIFVLWRLDGVLIEVRDELREIRHLLGDRRRNLRADDGRDAPL